ncbi:hypothetical protein LOCC1_G004774 [Lachnellula occidentalis]|uniref:Chitin-binding type-4 domain-containing protein n=1 Tax=Lachnellula occidentalis TaxID=215460 RepID=A0A8H8RUR9_9HELO|nr:hypothetical protein LOCC1_G004774 [Lachnellula occidentalis]
MRNTVTANGRNKLRRMFRSNPATRFATCLLTLSLSFRPASGHIVLKTPKPFIFAAYGPSNPISPDGSDFPCKMPPGTSKLQIDGTPTEMTIGEEQQASFTGIAVHGGGSCQFAISPGLMPNKTSAWSVIESIEGGCPAINKTGNLEDPETPNTYPFTIPVGITPGQYTFAWTWVNRIGGSAEFYMNCAPIVVKSDGPKSRRDKQRRAHMEKRAQYPDLFLANIGDAGNGCLTTDAHTAQVAIAYPNPGSNVVHPNGDPSGSGLGKLFHQVCDGNPRNSGGGSQPGPSASLPSASIAPALSSTQDASPTTSQAHVTSSTTSVTTSVPVSNPHTASGSAPPASQSGTCVEGHLLCVNGQQFSTCTGGIWTPPQPLGSGTHCTGGEGAGLTMVNS